MITFFADFRQSMITLHRFLASGYLIALELLCLLIKVDGILRRFLLTLKFNLFLFFFLVIPNLKHGGHRLRKNLLLSVLLRQ